MIKQRLYLLLAIMLLGSFGSYAQVKQGKITYIADFTGVYNKSVQNKKASLAALMQSVNTIAKDIKLELTFDETASSFSRSKGMAPDNNREAYETAMSLTLDGDYYTNLQEKRLLKTVTEDQTYIVDMPLLRPDNWILSKESKKIGKYTCYKATSSQSAEGLKGKATMKLTAWYAPEIPVRFGPKQYNNLPGLILEVQEGEVIYRCTSISLNQTDKINIVRPAKGKLLTAAAYDKMLEQRIADFKKNGEAR